jgi:hypothetical protein
MIDVFLRLLRQKKYAVYTSPIPPILHPRPLKVGSPPHNIPLILHPTSLQLEPPSVLSPYPSSNAPDSGVPTHPNHLILHLTSL